MRLWNVLIALCLLATPKWVAGNGMEPESEEESSGDIETGSGEGTEGTEEQVDGEDEDGKVTYFTAEWREMFSKKQLENQAKWYLAEEQPEDGTFQARVYLMQWWSTSHQACQEEIQATSNQYMSLYLFFNGYNYQRQSYPLTYPILFEVDKRPTPTVVPKATPKKKTTKPTRRPKKGGKRKGKKGGKRRRKKKPTPKPKVCPIKYTTYFYLPLPLEKWAPKTQDLTIKSFKKEEETYFVREYPGKLTSTADCEEEGRKLALDLLKNNIWTWETYFICAKYEPPEGETEQKLEVWMKKRL